MTKPPPNISLAKSDWDSLPGMHRFSHEAMATAFEIFILNDDARYAQQAANAAFDELDRLEAQLSRFIDNSDICRINKLAPYQFLSIGPETFECLQLSTRMYDQTNGAFDITVGCLKDYRPGSEKSTAHSEKQYNSAPLRAACSAIKLDENRHTVQLTEPVLIDLGGIGKGYAVDQMAKVLLEWSIDTALLHGGSSSVMAFGSLAGTNGWPVTLSSPVKPRETITHIDLQNSALGGSSLRQGQHIIDPRTALPAVGKVAAWACAPDTATADALSTAFMIMSAEEIEQYCLRHPDILAVVISQRPEKDEVLRFGPWKENDKL